MIPVEGTVAARIEAVLANPELGVGDSKVEAIELDYQAHGWEPAHDYLISVLEDPTRAVDDWMTCAAVFWGALLDGLSMNADRLIALLYKRLPHDEGSNESNLAWSIASGLKGKKYLSDYDPLADPAVLRELATVR